MRQLYQPCKFRRYLSFDAVLINYTKGKYPERIPTGDTHKVIKQIIFIHLDLVTQKTPLAFAAFVRLSQRQAAF